MFSLILIFLYCPLTNGYLYVYDYIIQPLLIKYEHTIGKTLDMARAEMEDKMKKGKKVIINEIID